MKFLIATAFMSLLATSSLAASTGVCWPSKGNWVNASTKSCGIVDQNNKGKPRHKCERPSNP